MSSVYAFIHGRGSKLDIGYRLFQGKGLSYGVLFRHCKAPLEFFWNPSGFSLECFTGFLIKHVVFMMYSMSPADKLSVEVCFR